MAPTPAAAGKRLTQVKTKPHVRTAMVALAVVGLMLGALTAIAFRLAVVEPSATVDEVLAAAHTAANAMEASRELPASVTVGSATLTPARYLRLAVSTLKLLLDDAAATGSRTVTLPAAMAEPATPYATANLLTSANAALYGEPLDRAGYQQVVNALDSGFFANGAATSMLVYQQGQIRYPEAFYLVSQLLRERRFFGRLPQVTELFVISPRGLVPWAVPAGYQPYTDVTRALQPNTGTAGYYHHSAHTYEVYRLARMLVSGTSDPYTAGQMIYDWSKGPGWIHLGYGTNSQGLGPRSSVEMVRSRRGSSVVPYPLNEGLMRAVNVPNDSHLTYFSSLGWRNIDNHVPYGTDPSSSTYLNDTHTNIHPAPPPPEPLHVPQLDQPLITAVKAMAAKARPTLPPMTTALFVNPGDLKTYGPQFIVDQVAASGLNTIIATVKPIWGGLYFSSRDAAFQADLLSPLLAAAKAKGLAVVAALSVLTDAEAVKAHPDWKSVWTSTTRN